MTGLEKILAEIREEAAAEAQQIEAKARAQADEILAQAKAQSAEKVAKTEAAAAQDVADIEQSRESALALQRRQRTLAKKQELLAETLEKARQNLLALPADTYFDLLCRLAAKQAQPGDGALLLNETDKQRLPKDFAQKLAAALPAGSSLAISDETRPIDGGFVLKYGDIEENGSFAATFDARADEFSDLIRDILFG